MLAHYRKRCKTVRREREIAGRRPLRLALHGAAKAVAVQLLGNRVHAAEIAPGAEVFSTSDILPEGERLMCGSSDLTWRLVPDPVKRLHLLPTWCVHSSFRWSNGRFLSRSIPDGGISLAAHLL